MFFPAAYPSYERVLRFHARIFANACLQNGELPDLPTGALPEA